jgi:hypothetical protein
MKEDGTATPSWDLQIKAIELIEERTSSRPGEKHVSHIIRILKVNNQKIKVIIVSVVISLPIICVARNYHCCCGSQDNSVRKYKRIREKHTSNSCMGTQVYDENANNWSNSFSFILT